MSNYHIFITSDRRKYYAKLLGENGRFPEDPTTLYLETAAAKRRGGGVLAGYKSDWGENGDIASNWCVNNPQFCHHTPKHNHTICTLKDV